MRPARPKQGFGVPLMAVELWCRALDAAPTADLP
jgi:hypothetical protein